MNRDIAHRRLFSWARGSASRCPTRSILELILNLTSELPYVSINNCGREIIFCMGASGLMCRAAHGHSPHRDRGPQRTALRQSPCRAPWYGIEMTQRTVGPGHGYHPGHLLESLEVLLDIRPPQAVVGLFQPAIQLFPQNKSQETAKGMTADGLVSFMKDGPGIQDRLHIPEHVFHLPEFHVLWGDLFGSQMGIGLEHPLSIELFFLPLMETVSRSRTTSGWLAGQRHPSGLAFRSNRPSNAGYRSKPLSPLRERGLWSLPLPDKPPDIDRHGKNLS